MRLDGDNPRTRAALTDSAQGLVESLIHLGHPGQLPELTANMPLEASIVIDARRLIGFLAGQLLEPLGEGGLVILVARCNGGEGLKRVESRLSTGSRRRFLTPGTIMDITPFAFVLLLVTGWIWTLRAGAAIQRFRSQPEARRKHIAIGNTIVSVIPFAVAVFIYWPR